MGNAAVEAWRAGGELVVHDGLEVFVVDEPASGQVQHDPLLVLHGFPSSSFDYRQVLGRLAEHRRVVLLDFLGFGFSSKPDVRYSMRMQADVAETVARHCALERVQLLTHDMGNTVGGELLRRSLEGTLPFEVSRRVITNGSIYIDMAQLTDGQQFLLAMPDEALGADGPPDGLKESYGNGMAQTFSEAHPPSAEERDAQYELLVHNDGYRMMTRTIRYVEDRRAEEERFTGAIVEHASPLTIVWGDLDPVAVYPMAEKLHAARPDAPLVTLTGLGHYPMIEDPDRFVAAVIDGLNG